MRSSPDVVNQPRCPPPFSSNVRIGVVTTSYPRWPGDSAGAFVGGLTRFFLAAGHEVEVVAAGPGAAVDGRLRILRVHAGAGLFYDEGAPDRLERSPSSWLRAPVFALALGGRVARAARTWDAVVSHWILPSGLAVALTARGLPHLAVAHSGDVHLAVKLGLASLLVHALMAGGRTRIVFSGEHLRERLLRAAPNSQLASFSAVCPMGIDAASLASARSRREEARAWLGLAPAMPAVVFLGRLVPIKGVNVLIDALGLVHREVTLVVAGSGPERVALEARARGLRAVFTGELRGAERNWLLAAADVVVVPSIDLPEGRTEGTPTVVLEALAAGVPLVASRVGGIAAVAEEAAWLVPPGDAAAIARGIEAALAEDEDRSARRAAGRRIAEAHDWQHVGPRLLAMLPL